MESTYVGAFNIMTSLLDVRIEFGSVEPQLDDNGDVVGEVRIPKTRIALPPFLAKELAQKLSAAIANY